MPNLRNIDLTDRELLHVIDEAAQESPDDTVSAMEIAVVLGYPVNGDRSALHAVSTRMAWMVRYGFVARIDPQTRQDGKRSGPVRWALTHIGDQIRRGRTNKAMD